MRNPRILALTIALGLSACSQVTGVAPQGDGTASPKEAALGSGDPQVQQVLRPQPFRTQPPWLRGRGAEPLVAWEFAVERELLRLTNEERQNAGLPSLASDTRLQSVARLHSLDQAAKNYSAHQSPDGKWASDRLRDAGIPFAWEAENIRWVSNRDLSVVARDMMHEGSFGWMNSPGHRANILDPKFSHVGIGVFKSSTNGRYYATQNFIQKP